jgi:hypothetical protein
MLFNESHDVGCPEVGQILRSLGPALSEELPKNKLVTESGLVCKSTFLG